ncbi:MAG: hypothetical protein HUK24_08825 [Sphaerochaetaceae bacterium]|nr:hypothetical protein [Sphaerochaetaceae bacterium]
MSAVLDGNGDDFLAEIQNKRGSVVNWKTFCTWYSDLKGNTRAYGVFLYRVQDTFWYEDFEHQTQLLGIRLQKPKGAPPYVKFENSFSGCDVNRFFKVRKSLAQKVSEGLLPKEKLKESKSLSSLLFETVYGVELNSKDILFFQVYDKTFAQLLEHYIKENHNGSI